MIFEEQPTASCRHESHTYLTLANKPGGHPTKNAEIKFPHFLFLYVYQVLTLNDRQLSPSPHHAQ